MGLSASQGRLLLLTAKQSDLEFRAQQISQKRLVLAQQLEQISKDYEDATSNRVMTIGLYKKGETDENGNHISTSANLTYKNLISGTISNSTIAESAGLQTGVYQVEATSNNFYRLIDPSGAIVVSSKDEIPSKYTITNTTDNTNKAVDNVYTIKNINATTGEETVASYYAVATGALAEALTKYRTENSSDKKTEENSSDKKTEDKTIKPSCEYDSTNGLLKIATDGTTKVYDIKTGSEVTGDDAKKFTRTNSESIILISSDQTGSIPSSTTSTSTQEDTKIVPGADGHYTVYAGGAILNRYIVDSGLKGGSNSADPNYLQDCLRNGKYLIEKYSSNDDTLGGATWDKVSWDATSNISDRYYTEDDATAKAIYDRKQNEIQNADKKLELELNNVEAQRNAVKTEIESVEKVMNDNIEKSFKPFQA